MPEEKPSVLFLPLNMILRWHDNSKLQQSSCDLKGIAERGWLQPWHRWVVHGITWLWNNLIPDFLSCASDSIPILYTAVCWTLGSVSTAAGLVSLCFKNLKSGECLYASVCSVMLGMPSVCKQHSVNIWSAKTNPALICFLAGESQKEPKSWMPWK